MFMCNGLFCSTHYFVPWQRHFSRDHRVVQFDYRSHGKSDDTPDLSSMTMAQFIDDAASVMKTTCQEKAIVVGHSMGVRVALELYARMPDRISALILLCGSAFDSLGPILSRFPLRQYLLAILRLGSHATPIAKMLKDLTVRNDLVSTVGYTLGGLSRTLTPREPVEGLLANLNRLDVRVMPPLASSYIRHSARPILPHVNVPTLFLVGEKDAMATPSHARISTRILPNAEPYVVRDCTHLAPVERPDEVHDAVSSFLSRHRVVP